MSRTEAANVPILSDAVLARASDLCTRFQSATPFKHVAIDDFFDEAFARALLAAFPPPDGEGSPNLYGASGYKAWHSDLTALADPFRRLDAFFRSPSFAAWISQATGIEGLTYDPSNFGGGTHENFAGRDLLPHVDFNYHPVTKLHRRLNLIVYLNEGWQPEWGGILSLYRDPRDPLGEVVAYEPSFNRCVAFETSEHSWHGFDLIAFPPNESHRSRRSLSIYLYTRERPVDEIYAEHTTHFVPRPLHPRFVAGYQLKADDARELAGLVGHRDRLIELYQRELSTRESDSEQAARLRMELAQEAQRRSVPIAGYAQQDGPAQGLHSDGWAGESLSLVLRPARDVVALRFDLRFPHGLAPRTQMVFELNGAAHLMNVHEETLQLTQPVAIAAGEQLHIKLSINETVNHAKLGVSSDQRDLGFLLERITVEHGTPPLEGTPAIITVIGDCHAAAFDSVLLEPHIMGDRPIVARALWESYAQAKTAMTGGRPSLEVTRMLYLARRLRARKDGRTDSPFPPLALRTANDTVSEVFLEPRAPEDVLVLSYGDPDVWDVIALSPSPPDERLLESLLHERLDAYARLLEALLQAGFVNVCALAVPPPARIDRFDLRVAAAKAANRCIESFCVRLGLRFVPTWQVLAARDGSRDGAFDRDGIHLNYRGAATILRLVAGMGDTRSS